MKHIRAKAVFDEDGELMGYLSMPGDVFFNIKTIAIVDYDDEANILIGAVERAAKQGEVIRLDADTDSYLIAWSL